MRQSVDLLLVNPGNRVEQFASLAPLATVAQPLGIAMLAAYVREHGIGVAIFDAEAYGLTPVEAADQIESLYNPPLLVGLSAFTTKMTSAGHIMQELKQRWPETKMMCGGHHPSAIPERTLREEATDFVIKGEGFYPVTELIQRLKWKEHCYDIKGVWLWRPDGTVHAGGQAPGPPKLDELPFTAWDLLPMDRYKAHHWQSWGRGEIDTTGFSLIHTSLGCPFTCQFCSVNVVYERHTVRYRSPVRVVDEIEHLINEYGVQHFEFIDDTFTTNRKHVEAICDEIIGRRLGDKINAWAFSRVDRSDPRFLSKMKAAGINWVFMGLESGNDTVLLGVDKGQTVVEIREAVDKVHAAGIHIGGNFVFGLPEDTHESMAQTLALAKDLNTEYINLFIMMSYPGSFMHDTAPPIDALPKRWSQYGFFTPDSMPLRNAKLSSREIVEFRDQAFKEYFNSERYQQMVQDTFGLETIKFLREQVLSKQIERKMI